MYVISFRCCRNESGVSATTWRTRMRVYDERVSRLHGPGDRRGGNLEILDEALEEGDEMLRLADVPRDGFRQEIFGKDWHHA